MFWFIRRKHLYTRDTTQKSVLLLLFTSSSPSEKRHFSYFDEWSEWYLQGDVCFHRTGPTGLSAECVPHNIYWSIPQQFRDEKPFGYRRAQYNTMVVPCVKGNKLQMFWKECSKPNALSGGHWRELYSVRALKAWDRVHYIPCECGGSYIGEIGRPSGLKFWEQKNNLKQHLMDKSKLFPHAYKEGHP